MYATNGGATARSLNNRGYCFYDMSIETRNSLVFIISQLVKNNIHILILSKIHVENLTTYANIFTNKLPGENLVHAFL